GQGEDRLVDHDDRELGAGDRAPAGVLHLDVDPGEAARLDLAEARRDLDVEGAGDGRDREVERALAVGGPARQAGVRLAVVIEPGRRSDQVDLDEDVGHVGLGDRHLEGGGGALHLEGAGLGDAGAADGEEPVGGVEGRLDQEPGGLARPVLLAVRDQRDLLLLDVADRRHVAAGDPDEDLAGAGAAGLVGHGRGDAVGAALGSLEGAEAGLVCRLDRAGLRVCLFFLPLALLPRPVEPDGLHVDDGADGGVTLVVDRDGLDLDGDALVDEVAVLLEADVELGGVDQERGGAGPGLPVDVLHVGLGDEGRRGRWVDAEEVDPEGVLAGGVGLALERLVAGLVRHVVVVGPPRLPDAEDEAVVAGRAEAGRLGADAPAHVGAGEAAAGVVGRLDGDVGGGGDQVRPLAGGGGDLVLRPAKLLDLEAVVVLPAALAAGGELDPGVAEVGRGGQGEAGVEAAERVDVDLALGDLVAARADDGVAHVVHQAGGPLDVAALAEVDHADPALEVDLLAGPVHLAVVVDEPGELLAVLALAPAAVVAPP